MPLSISITSIAGVAGKRIDYIRIDYIRRLTFRAFADPVRQHLERVLVAVIAVVCYFIKMHSTGEFICVAEDVTIYARRYST